MERRGVRSERQCESYCSLQKRVLHIHSLEWLTSTDWIVQTVMGGLYRLVLIGKLRVKFKFILIFVVFFLVEFLSSSLLWFVFTYVCRTLISYVRKRGRVGGVQSEVGFSCEVLVSDWLFLVDCSKAVQLFVGRNYCSEKKMIDRTANLPDSFTCKIEYLCIYLHLEK